MSKFLQIVLSLLIMSSVFVASKAFAQTSVVKINDKQWALKNNTDRRQSISVNYYYSFNVEPGQYKIVGYERLESNSVGSLIFGETTSKIVPQGGGSLADYNRLVSGVANTGSGLIDSGKKFFGSLTNRNQNNNNSEEVVAETPPPIEPTQRVAPNQPAPPTQSAGTASEAASRSSRWARQLWIACYQQGLTENGNVMQKQICAESEKAYKACESGDNYNCFVGNETEYKRKLAMLEENNYQGPAAIMAARQSLREAVEKCNARPALTEEQSAVCKAARSHYEVCDFDADKCSYAEDTSRKVSAIFSEEAEPTGRRFSDGSVNEESISVASNAVDPEALIAQVEQQKNACKETRTTAVRCCGSEALSCVDGGNGSNETQLAAVAAQIAAMYSTGNSAGLKQQCDAYQRMYATSGALSGRAAQVCGSKRIRCEDKCGDYRQALLDLKPQCNGDQSCEYAIDGEVGVAQREVTTCNDESDLKRQEDQLLVSTASSFSNVAVSAQCSGAVTQQSVDSNGNPINPALGVDGCSSPENASNPYCLAQTCSQPGSENLPQCGGSQPINPTVPTSPGGGFSNGNSVAGSDSGADFLANSPSQSFDGNPDSNALNNEPNSLVSVQGGGGSGAPGTGGGGGSGAGTGSAGGAPSASSQGYNTKILKGARGGSGYSVSRGSTRSGGGGFKGYGRGSKSKSSGYKPLSLKDFLPGGKKDPRRKGASAVRGVASTGEAINVSHSDIWKKMSSKYSEVCLRKQLTCSGRKSRIPLKQ